jgi:5-methylcytosine-specific restriction endonuclease McrA
MGGAWAQPPGWARIRQQVFAAKGRRCHWCGRYATTVDHVVPLAIGGSHDLANLVPACQPCNSRRGAQFGNRRRSGRPPPRRYSRW